LRNFLTGINYIWFCATQNIYDSPISSWISQYFTSTSSNTDLALVLWQQELRALIKHAPASIISSYIYYSLGCSKYVSVAPEVVYKCKKGFLSLMVS